MSSTLSPVFVIISYPLHLLHTNILTCDWPPWLSLFLLDESSLSNVGRDSAVMEPICLGAARETLNISIKKTKPLFCFFCERSNHISCVTYSISFFTTLRNYYYWFVFSKSLLHFWLCSNVLPAIVIPFFQIMNSFVRVKVNLVCEDGVNITLLLRRVLNKKFQKDAC